MKYDSKTIEESGVDKVKEVLRQVNTLDPNINHNDKNVSWDGSILVYNDVPFKKEILRFKIPIQVKTRTLTKYKSSYSVSVADLKNYRIDGSILYFLVEIVNNEFKIYYTALFLIDLEKIIKAAGKNKSKRINFKEFPTDADTIKYIIENYINNASKQKQLIQGVYDLDSFRRMYPNQPVKFEISLPQNPKASDILNSINEQKPYLYFQSETGFKAPIGRFDGIMLSLSSNNECEISVDGEVLYHTLTKETSLDNKTRLKIGKTIIFTLSKKDIEFTYSLDGLDLTEAIKTLKFVLGVVDQRNVLFGFKDESMPLILSNIHTDMKGAFSLETLVRQLDIYLDVQKLFNNLGIRKELVIRSLSENDYKKLICFCQSELYGKPLSLTALKSKVGFLHIGDINIYCYCSQAEEEGLYYVNSFFRRDLISVRLSDGTTPISNYATLANFGIEGFRQIDNINYDDLILSLDVANPNQEVLSIYNTLFLIMLSYYDEVGERRIANACLWLAEYLWNHFKEDFSFINLCQVKYRIDTLSKDDKTQLFKIKNSNESNIIKLACSILLNSFTESEMYYDLLNEEEHQQFDGYPIKYIWKE